MGLQEISERKVRKAAEGTGLDLIRAMRHSNNLWFGWVREGEGHWHMDIHPETWEWEYQPGCGFSSCREQTYGPGVIPSDPDVIAAHERAEEERRTASIQAEEDWRNVVAQWKSITEQQIAKETPA